MNIETANRLVKLRKDNGYTQEQLAEALGISRQAVSKWERAESSPDTDNLICLAKLYNMSLDDLLNTSKIVNNENNESNDTYFNISTTGIHYKDDEDEAHISVTGIKIKSKDATIIIGKTDEEIEKDDSHPILNIINAALPITCAIIYIILGFGFSLWHPGWIVFLLIPCWYTLVSSIKKQNFARFTYPVFITFIYILICDIFSIWHPFWIIYLTIPLYYIIVRYLKNHK